MRRASCNWAAPIASAAVTAVLPFIFIVLRKFFPHRPAPDEPAITPEQLQKLTRKYWWVYLVGFVAILVFGALFTWAWIRLLVGLDNWCLSKLSPSQYLIKPGLVVWFLPSLFLALISMALPLDLLCRLMLRRNYAEYMRMENLRYGFDGTKACIAFAVPVVALSGLFVGLACDWYLRVTDDYITWNRLWSFGERRYSFSEVDNSSKFLKNVIWTGMSNIGSNISLFSATVGYGAATRWEQAESGCGRQTAIAIYMKCLSLSKAKQGNALATPNPRKACFHRRIGNLVVVTTLPQIRKSPNSSDSIGIKQRIGAD